MPDASAISLDGDHLLLDNGEIVDVTKWLDHEGEDCWREDAAACVAGPCSNGNWYSVDLRELVGATHH